MQRRKEDKGLSKLVLLLFAGAVLFAGGCAGVLPVPGGVASWYTHNPERNVHLNIKVTSKPEEADIYYAPMKKAGILPDKEKYVHAGKTPVTLELLLHHPKGSADGYWEPASYHIVAKKEGYKTTEACFSTMGIGFQQPSPDGKNYQVYGQWYRPKDKEKIFVNNPGLTKFDVDWEMPFELIKEEAEEGSEVKELGEGEVITE